MWMRVGALALAVATVACSSTREDAGNPAADRARDEKAKVVAAVSEERWNDALSGVEKLDRLCTDEAVRKSIGVDALRAQVVAGRDAYFQGCVPVNAYWVLGDLIDKKGAREPTLAAAREWASRDLPAAWWKAVGSDLGLTTDELEKYWKGRRAKATRQASYGSGTFVVAKRRIPAAAQAAALTDTGAEERWWSGADAASRSNFLTAYFVETSGDFLIVGVDERPCETCRGSGFAEEHRGTDIVRFACRTCNGCGAFRSVTYR